MVKANYCYYCYYLTCRLNCYCYYCYYCSGNLPMNLQIVCLRLRALPTNTGLT